ncbi:hypothetical protein [Parafrankia sp. BMG5.11]|uniref:hypothetical protein n=1 Tax=Parafrankia sp. BMG5.11 TaxID=222540 RepID=UPI0010397B7E|nr:hypothetical protein [Parafrankia sp. BMG5.11]TCJ39083.1 hypothetical protein E0504_12435 [Parafrankia sp. BMG5.11]
MSDRLPDTGESTPLNPALKSTSETVYDTTNRTPSPIDTASAREGEGEGWPWIWLVVTVVCVALAIWFLL